MNKILVIGTGGTIGSIKDEHIHLDTPFKILDYINIKDVEFDCVSPFTVLSENMSFALWQKLTDYIDSIDFNKYSGAIVLHGSDSCTLQVHCLPICFMTSPLCLWQVTSLWRTKALTASIILKLRLSILKTELTGFISAMTDFTELKISSRLKNPVLKFKKSLSFHPTLA